jgi:aspartyl-tRNA synthetase
MRRYGTDKPDLRFGAPIVDVTASATTEGADVPLPTWLAEKLRGGSVLRALCLRGARSIFSRAALQSKGLIVAEPVSASEWRAPPKSAALFADARRRASMDAALGGVRQDDVLLFAVGTPSETSVLLGRERLHWGRELLARGMWLPQDALHFSWVIDFPLFELADGKLASVHHPFTAPAPEDEATLRAAAAAAADARRATISAENPLLSLRAQSYDLVLNGAEVGGGSVRIHERALQEGVLSLLGASAATQLGHLLEALSYGAPPHGGFALGLDRFVATLCGAESIRDVIAFPKNLQGHDPLTGAPSEVDAEALAEYGLRVAKE